MRRMVLVLAAAALPLAAPAQDAPAPAAGGADVAAAGTTATDAAPTGAPDAPFAGPDVALADFLWTARPIVVFADSPADPAFRRQMDLLRQRPAALADREVVVITDTDPDARSDVRRTLRPRGFALVVLGKDGQVITRKPSPWDVREISRAIDRTPLRRQEMRDRGLSGAAAP